MQPGVQMLDLLMCEHRDRSINESSIFTDQVHAWQNAKAIAADSCRNNIRDADSGLLQDIRTHECAVKKDLYAPRAHPWILSSRRAAAIIDFRALRLESRYPIIDCYHAAIHLFVQSIHARDTKQIRNLLIG